MKINHNISAQLANVSLRKNDRRLSSALERLSSGYKINKASDDSAGLAISNKMRTQIRALDRASDNANDGVSIIQTAEGAISEIQSILQRVRELGVQSANDTNTVDDRAAIEEEVGKMMDEIDRIASTADYNGQGLLDGSCDRAVLYDQNGFENVYLSDYVEAGEYSFEVTQLAEAAEATLEYRIPGAGEEPATISIDGVSIEITSEDTDETVAAKVMEVCSVLDIKVAISPAGQEFTLQTAAAGSNQYITYKGVDDDKAQTVRGLDAKAEAAGGFPANVAVTGNGDYVTFTDSTGFEMEVHVSKKETVKATVYDSGSMRIQVGAYEHEDISINFSKLSCETLGLRDREGNDIINMGCSGNATRSLEVLDGALSRVSTLRSQLGAYENRLNSTISSLDISEENLTDSMSRIMDTDMASAMTEYTQLNVMTEAATSMLAQANNKPQQILNLIQG